MNASIKRFVKRMGAAFFALLMALSVVVPAYAATGATGKITVTGLEEKATVKAYMVLEQDSSTGAWKLTSWAATAIGETNKADALTQLTNSGNSDKSDVAKYLNMLAAYESKTAAATVTLTGDATEAVLETSDGEGLPLGSYLIVCSSDSYIYTNMLQNNYDEGSANGIQDVFVAAKGVKKSIVEEKTAADTKVAIGDVVSYKVKVKMPHFNGTYVTDGNSNVTSPKLVITDDMNNVMSLSDSDGTIVTGTPTVGTSDANIVLAWESGQGNSVNLPGAATAALKVGENSGFTLTFDPEWLSENAANIAGQEFTLTYYAKITALGSGMKENELVNKVAGIVNVDGTDTTIPEIDEKVYTVGLQLNKYGVKGENSVVVTGATFALKTSEGKWLNFTNGVFSGYSAEADAPDAAKIAVDEDGRATVKGIDPGLTYTLVELVAPAGYSKIKDTTIAFTQSETKDEEYKFTASATVNGDTSTEVVATDSTAGPVYSLDVKDSALGALPSTGGMGMVVMTVAGAAAVAAFGTGIIALRKKSEK